MTDSSPLWTLEIIVGSDCTIHAMLKTWSKPFYSNYFPKASKKAYITKDLAQAPVQENVS